MQEKKPTSFEDDTLSIKIESEPLPDIDGVDIEVLLPSMNVSKELQTEKKECIVKDEVLLNLYDEILNDCRDNRKSVAEVTDMFHDMVSNDGDATAASKEAIVNLYKIQTDISDKMTKIADLMTRIKLRERDTMPGFLAAQQNNKVVIEGNRRDLLKHFNKEQNDLRKNNDKKA